MPSTRELKGRIRSVQNVAKITNALQLVAASRMRRAQQRAVAARPYAERLRYVLGNLSAQNAGGDDGGGHPLLQQREGNRTLLVYFSPNRGLAGSLPGNLNRRAATYLLDEAGDGATVVAAGRKGRDFLQRHGSRIIAEFNELGDYPELADVLGIARVAVEEFTEGRVDRVVILYAEFINTVSQRPRLIQLLPVVPPARTEEGGGGRAVEYIYEPGADVVLERLLPRYVDMVIYNAALEAVASEQSARFVAMKNATDSATDLIESLRLTLNKARQDSITRELLDIIGGVAALEG
jgi:F-type H+-transporting ATPase subunit gamma